MRDDFFTSEKHNHPVQEAPFSEMGSVVDYDVRIASLLEGLEALPKSLVLFETAYPAKLFDRLGTIFPSIQDSDLRNKILKDYYVGVQGSEGRISWPVYLNGVQMLSKAFQAARNDGTYDHNCCPFLQLLPYLPDTA